MAISKLRSIGLPLNPSSPSNASLTGMLPRRPSPFCQSRPSSGWQERPSSSQTTVLGTPYPELPPNYSERNGNHGIASPPKLLPSPDLIQGFSSDRLRNVNFSMPPPDIRHGSAGTLSSTIHQNCTNSQVSFPQEAEVAPRPWTAPVSQVSDSLSQFLPPRRELPFDKPAAGSSSKSTTGNTGLKTSELGQDLSPPPKPTVAKKSGTRGAKQPPKIKGRAQKPLQAKKGKSSPQKEVADRNSKTTGEEASIQSLGATLLVVADGQSNVPAPSVSSSSKATLVEVAPPGRKRPLSELEASEDNGRRPLAATPQRSVSGIPSQMQPNQMEFDLPTVTTNQPESPNAIEDVSAEYLDRIDTFVSKHMSRPPPDANGSLAGYAAQSDEDRMAAIDDMICQNIMDDDFLKLCEDVENSWRRIGLGV
ncbi:MAG: hypothetical protein M1830_002859 [Pleopsidium flavum]|nr:MAG: hypothetical protein M1830_002859 [Pleopsidium flavum]